MKWGHTDWEGIKFEVLHGPLSLSLISGVKLVSLN